MDSAARSDCRRSATPAPIARLIQIVVFAAAVAFSMAAVAWDQPLWTRSLGVVTQYYYFVRIDAGVDANRNVVAFAQVPLEPGRLRAFAADGRPLWSRPLAAGADVADLAVRPDGGFYLTGDTAGNGVWLARFDRTGRLLWRRSDGVPITYADDYERLKFAGGIVADGNRAAFAFGVAGKTLTPQGYEGDTQWLARYRAKDAIKTWHRRMTFHRYQDIPAGGIQAVVVDHDGATVVAGSHFARLDYADVVFVHRYDADGTEVARRTLALPKDLLPSPALALAVDRTGDVVVAISGDDPFPHVSLWKLAPDLGLRWTVDLPQPKDVDARVGGVAVDGGGRILVLLARGWWAYPNYVHAAEIRIFGPAGRFLRRIPIDGSPASIAVDAADDIIVTTIGDDNVATVAKYAGRE